MSELAQPRWAVISERGCEATGLPHADAARLVRALKEERVRGLCVVTDRAARPLPAAGPQPAPASPTTRKPAKSTPGRRGKATNS